MNKKNKKGFTLVELVIVIAVIAVLAAVLIPTFSTVISKSHTSADVQEARNLKTEIITYFSDFNADFDKIIENCEIDSSKTTTIKLTATAAGTNAALAALKDPGYDMSEVVKDAKSFAIKEEETGGKKFLTYQSQYGTYVKITADKIETSNTEFKFKQNN